MRTGSLIALVAALLTLGSCNRDQVLYEQFYDIADGRWSYGQTYDFEFPVDDTTGVFRLLVFFDFDTEYNWENFYANLRTQFPGDSVRSDIISFEFANSAGEWYGDCSSESCRLTIPLQEKVRFPNIGTYRISFEQYMRQETVRGINSIGLKLVLPKNQREG